MEKKISSLFVTAVLFGWLEEFGSNIVFYRNKVSCAFSGVFFFKNLQFHPSIRRLTLKVPKTIKTEPQLSVFFTQLKALQTSRSAFIYTRSSKKPTKSNLLANLSANLPIHLQQACHYDTHTHRRSSENMSETTAGGQGGGLGGAGGLSRGVSTFPV